MIIKIQEDNNNAVEQMLMGHPEDAIATLLHCLDTFRVNLRCGDEYKHLSSASSAMQAGGAHKQLYSVELCSDVEVLEPAFPFRWYGKPIAITSSSEHAEEGTPQVHLDHDLTLAVILFNLGVAYQLKAVQKHKEPDFGMGRIARTAALDAYTLALSALVTIQDIMHLSGRFLERSERLDFGLLHAATVNNMLFLYAQRADIQGMSTCLALLRRVLSAFCTQLPECDVEEFVLFHLNVILFPNPGSLSLAPAA